MSTTRVHAQHLARHGEEVEALQEENAFLARMVLLAPKGHATADEHERLRVISERRARFPRRKSPGGKSDERP